MWRMATRLDTTDLDQIVSQNLWGNISWMLKILLKFLSVNRILKAFHFVRKVSHRGDNMSRFVLG
jgi:hypothetical protein